MYMQSIIEGEVYDCIGGVNLFKCLDALYEPEVIEIDCFLGNQFAYYETLYLYVGDVQDSVKGLLHQYKQTDIDDIYETM